MKWLLIGWKGAVGSAKIFLKHLFSGFYSKQYVFLHALNLAWKSCVSSLFGNIQFHDHGCKARINALEPEVESCNHKICFFQFFTALALEKLFFFPRYLPTYFNLRTIFKWSSLTDLSNCCKSMSVEWETAGKRRCVVFIYFKLFFQAKFKFIETEHSNIKTAVNRCQWNPKL